MLTLFELFGAVFLLIWCENGVPVSTPNQKFFGITPLVRINGSFMLALIIPP